MLVRTTGFEPVASAFGGQRSNPLSYARVLVDPAGLEPATSGVSNQRSPSELRIRSVVDGGPYWIRTSDLLGVIQALSR
jgi:hypothetical protein